MSGHEGSVRHSGDTRLQDALPRKGWCQGERPDGHLLLGWCWWDHWPRLLRCIWRKCLIIVRNLSFLTHIFLLHHLLPPRFCFRFCYHYNPIKSIQRFILECINIFIYWLNLKKYFTNRNSNYPWDINIYFTYRQHAEYKNTGTKFRASSMKINWNIIFRTPNHRLQE